MSAIQVKNVPDDVHGELRAKAAAKGVTLSEYVLELLRHDLRKNRTAAWLDELASRPPVPVPHDFDASEEVRRSRQEREDHLYAVWLGNAEP